jgi:hypothetical protein
MAASLSFSIKIPRFMLGSSDVGGDHLIGKTVLKEGKYPFQ